ncbi:unnamed protein product [Caretta caretta]
MVSLMNISTIRELLFTTDKVRVAPNEEERQQLFNRFALACDDEFGLSIILKKTNIMAQSELTAPEVLIASPTLKAVRMFGYLGSTASDNLSRDDELGSCIRKSATTFDQLTRHVWH